MSSLDTIKKELLSYQGDSPCPADFDHYWSEALAELDRQALDVQLVSASFQAPNASCYDLYFTGVGGSRVHAKLLQPAKLERPSPAVVQFHGYRGSSANWFDKLAYVNAGFSVATMDCRGQGGLSEDCGAVHGPTAFGHVIRGVDDPDPRKLYYRQVFLDTVALVRIVMGLPGVAADRIGLAGGSQGGGLTIACAALEPRVRCAVATYPFLSDYRKALTLGKHGDGHEEMTYYFRQFDPLHEREDVFFERLGYIDVQNLAPRIRCRFHMHTGLLDTTCFPVTQFAAYNKITSPKDFTLYPEFGHETLLQSADKIYQFLLQNLLS